MKRVVITGIGAVTPLGNSFMESWRSLLSGSSGLGQLPEHLVSRGVTLGGQLKGFDASHFLTVREINRLDPFVHYAVAAADMAFGDSALCQLEGLACIIGTSRGGIMTIDAAARRMSAQESAQRTVSAYLMPATTASMAASFISQKFTLRGHTLGISNACTSGANAVGEAYRLIKHGYAKASVAGGAEAPLCRICIDGYEASGALTKAASQTASRPFCALRDGFVLAEGACVLLLEEYESALRRGARIYSEVLGYGNTSDGFHMVRPESAMQAAAMLGALGEAFIALDDVAFVNAHATSTPLGDAVESEAINMAFGDIAKRLPVTANKSMTGHMLSASAAFETAVSAMSIYTGLITPSVNIKEVDSKCNINVVTETMKVSDIRAGISNSFGFGGVNASIVLGRTGGGDLI